MLRRKMHSSLARCTLRFTSRASQRRPSVAKCVALRCVALRCVELLALLTRWPTLQILKQFTFYAYLSGSQMVPPITTPGVGCAAISINPNKVVNYEIHHTVTNPASVVLLQGDVGVVGSFDNTLATFTYDCWTCVRANPRASSSSSHWRLCL